MARPNVTLFWLHQLVLVMMNVRANPTDVFGHLAGIAECVEWRSKPRARRARSFPVLWSGLYPLYRYTAEMLGDISSVKATL